MIKIPAKQAVVEFEKLLDKAAKGQEVVIVSADGSTFKLTALPHMPKPLFGSAKRLVFIGPDFDEPVEGFEETV